MEKRDMEFQQRLLATFRIEASEHIQAITTGLLALEQNPATTECQSLIETVFRAAHSLKGAARAVNLSEIEMICQALESVFAAFKAQQLTGSQAIYDLMHRGINAIETVLAASGTAHGIKVSALVRQLDVASLRKSTELTHSPEKSSPFPLPPALETGHVVEVDAADMPVLSPVYSPQIPREMPSFSGTVRIPTERLDALLFQSEELIPIKLAVRQRLEELREVSELFAQLRKRYALAAMEAQNTWLMRNPAGIPGAGETAMPRKVVDAFAWITQQQQTIESRLNNLTLATYHNDLELNGAVNGLLDFVKTLLMLPCSTLLDLFPKLVRDLSRDRGKEVALRLHGGEIELDKRILEGLKDPLIHLLRNSIDHGIEAPELREQQGKPRQGTILLAITQLPDNKVEIRVTDDGMGIDTAAVRSAAIKQGTLSPEQAEELTDEEALALVFQSGLSTNAIITDISGRGLGLAIVRENIEKLGGQFSVSSRHGEGTTFRLLLPVTLATFKGILVESAGSFFVIPTANVERVIRVQQADIRMVENAETILLDGQPCSLVRLSAVLGIPHERNSTDAGGYFPAIVLRVGDQNVAFQVDLILHEQEVLVKSMGKQLMRVRNFAGATVLGSGKVVPILNVADLFKSIRKSPARTPGEFLRRESEQVRHAILVAEDSITSRMLLKNILESAGYLVATAVDGADALAQLKTQPFDAMISDVDMPRMNGFDLTAAVRRDQHLAELPVVLVTSLDAREDRERGIDAGANAYIVKSSFDHSNLLETLERLL